MFHCLEARVGRCPRDRGLVSQKMEMENIGNYNAFRTHASGLMETFGSYGVFRCVSENHCNSSDVRRVCPTNAVITKCFN